MTLLHSGMYVLGAFYLLLGAVIVWVALRPSCRICVYRRDCPNRVHRYVVPECARKKTESEFTAHGGSTRVPCDPEATRSQPAL